MARLTWDQSGERYFEAGIKNVVLFVAPAKGETPAGETGDSDYLAGVNWNGVTKVGESPDGADANDLWADDIKYASFRSAEEFNGSIEAYQYPDEFALCNGERKVGGMTFGQQPRRAFGLAYVTTVGNDVEGFELGYKLHLVYNATCSPSSRDHETINDSPDAETMSWDFETTPVNIGTIDGVEYKPTSHVVIDSRDFTASGKKAKLDALLDAVWGTDASGQTEGTDAYLPKPAKVYEILTSQ